MSLTVILMNIDALEKLSVYFGHQNVNDNGTNIGSKYISITCNILEIPLLITWQLCVQQCLSANAPSMRWALTLGRFPYL